jgi:phosphatidylglycerophosphate synthase
VIAASPLGKGKMVAQVTTIFLLLLSRRWPALSPLAVLGLWVVLIVTVVSGIDYFRRFFFERPAHEKGPAAGRASEALPPAGAVAASAAPPSLRS